MLGPAIIQALPFIGVCQPLVDFVSDKQYKKQMKTKASAKSE